MEAVESPDVDRRARPGDEPGRAADSSAEQAQHTEARQTSVSTARESERDASARGAAGADAPRGRVLQLFAAMHSPPGADLARRAAAPLHTAASLHAAASGAMHSGREPHSAQRNSQRASAVSDQEPSAGYGSAARRATAVLPDPHMLPPLAPRGGVPKPPPRAGAPPHLAGLSPIAEARERSAQLSFSLSPSPAPPAFRAASPAQPRSAAHGSSRGSATSTLRWGPPLRARARRRAPPPTTPPTAVSDLPEFPGQAQPGLISACVVVGVARQTARPRSWFDCAILGIRSKPFKSMCLRPSYPFSQRLNLPVKCSHAMATTRHGTRATSHRHLQIARLRSPNARCRELLCEPLELPGPERHPLGLADLHHGPSPLLQ